MPVPILIAVIVASFALIILIVCAFLAKYLVYPPKPSFKETYRLEAVMNYLRDYDEEKSEYFTVKSFDGYELHAELLKATEKTEKYVILSHGYSYDRHGSIKYTHLFRSLGFNCIIYDSRGHGLNKKAPCSFGVNEGRDILKIIDDCRNRFGDRILLGLHGESMGSALSAISLGDKPPVDFAVLDCGYADFRSVVEEKLHSFHLPTVLIYPVEWMCRLLFHVSIFRARPVDALKNNEIPLCIIHGEEDELIPFSHAERLKEANKGYAELHSFSGAEHAKSFLTDEERYFQILKSFLSSIEKTGEKRL